LIQLKSNNAWSIYENTSCNYVTGFEQVNRIPCTHNATSVWCACPESTNITIFNFDRTILKLTNTISKVASPSVDVSVMCVFGYNVLVAGYFYQAGHTPTKQWYAIWNGEKWTTPSIPDFNPSFNENIPLQCTVDEQDNLWIAFHTEPFTVYMG
jgi:hypothetical protein